MRERLAMPLFIPLGALAVIFLLMFSVGKILFELDNQFVATAIAISIASLILLACTVLALAPRVATEKLYIFAGVPVALLIAIGLYLQVRPEAATGEGGAAGARPAAVTSVTEIATDNKFSVTATAVPANQEVTLQLENQGQALHNWRLLGAKDKDGKDVATQLLAAGKSETIKFTLAQAGTFDFRCDVHPTEMTGKLTVVEGGAAAGAAGGAAASGAAPAAAGGNTVVATDNKFDKTAMTVKANEETTVTFQNKGSALHNWHVLNVKDKSGKDVTTQLIGGGKTETVTFTITQAGTYDYQCDVHPVEMKGKLTVQ